MRILFLQFTLLLLSGVLQAQSLSSLRTTTISSKQDTIIVDTLSIAPGTFVVFSENAIIDSSAYELDFIHSRFTWKKESASYRNIVSDSVKIRYRVFSFLLGKEFQRKEQGLIGRGESEPPRFYNPGTDRPELFQVQGLTKNGSISRGITFGNNQDVFVNSSLNLQLAGKLGDDIDILAAITDENIPVQPEGNTQQLQEFDKVFIQLSNKRNKLIAGDFELKRPDSYFMNFFKKGQGGYFTTEIPLNKEGASKKRVLRSGISLASSKGKFARNTLAVSEGNQGPYKLRGSNGESFIIILSGTEKIFFDGVLLERGAQHDYVIDYNTAELTFTTRRLITKDSRIVADFEYSDKNFARSLIYLNNEYESEKLSIKFNLCSEQDSKNQPLAFDLDSARQAAMADVGDSIQFAFYPAADSVEFNSNEVLYQKKDTITPSGIYSIYLFSTNPDSARWRVGFSDVGLNRGDYIQDIGAANGRVFRWVEPAGGVPQGNYAPVTLLITPKKQQMVTTSATYQFNRNNSLSVEGAYSNHDVNLFSKKDKSDNEGYAARILYKNEIPLGDDTVKGIKLQNVINYEYAGKYFRPLERYRNVEFERDWNLGTSNVLNDEHIGSFKTTLIKPSIYSIGYQLRSYSKGSEYDGLMHSGNANVTYSKFTLTGIASYLNTEGLNIKTNFFRHSVELSRPVWKLVAGIRENSEDNRFKGLQSDSLFANSFSFNEWIGYVNTGVQTKSKAGISYKQRTDKLPAGNAFREVTKSEEVNFTSEFSKNPDNTLRTTTTYRTLKVVDTLLTSQEPVKTLLNRIDHTFTIWKKILSFNTFYEVGSGQERKQEYYYLRVNDGQGVYAWIDANQDGVEQLSEFVVSAFQDQAKYIRVFIPTSEYISTRSSQFSEVLTISPSGARSSVQGKKIFIHRFSNQLSLRLDRKTKEESLLSSLNPFLQDLSDTLLISSSANVRNTLYYNRSSAVFGMDLTWFENRNKLFLTNGFETRTLRSRIVNARWNINREFLVTLNYENSDKINQSDFFSNRDYSIFSNSTEPKLTYQPGNSFRISGSYKYGDKKNTKGTLGERAILNRFLLEMKLTSVNSGNITAKASLLNINYNAADDSFLSYEMLEGFKNGRNYTWGVAVQRNLSKSLQLSLTYDGRKLQDSPMVHTGGMQFRAYF